jgi:hypothetical protein
MPTHVRLPAEPAAVVRPNREHTLRFPFGTQAALAVWRALYFRPAAHVDDPARSPEWNRGAYLVEGLATAMPATRAQRARRDPRHARPAGRPDPGAELVCPSLASPHEASVAAWPKHEVVQLLKTGIAPQGFVMGPMSEVVLNSTQHLSDADLSADGDLPAGHCRRLPRPSRRRPPCPHPVPAARRSTRTIASPATASGARASRVPIRRWRRAGR